MYCTRIKIMNIMDDKTKLKTQMEINKTQIK